MAHGPISQKIKQVLAYIDMNYNQKITLSTVSSQVGIHPQYLSKRFKKELGIGLHEYLLRKRIQKAHFLLVESVKSIKEISYELGFSCPESFSRSFKRLTGYTPKSYRIHRNRYDVTDGIDVNF